MACIKAKIIFLYLFSLEISDTIRNIAKNSKKEGIKLELAKKVKIKFCRYRSKDIKRIEFIKPLK